MHNFALQFLALGVLVSLFCSKGAMALNGAAFRTLTVPSQQSTNGSLSDCPKLILVGGCAGTGKSTLGMSLALDQGILSCVSTETLRTVMKSFIAPDISPALHRSTTFEPNGQNEDPIKSWRETCTVLRRSIEELLDETIQKGRSLVLEGSHLIPSDDLMKKWEKSGGTAVGILLEVPSEDIHRSMLLKRGTLLGQDGEEQQKAFQRVRVIQEEMVRLAQSAGWLVVEQNMLPDPMETVARKLWKKEPDTSYFSINQLTSPLSQNQQTWIRPKKTLLVP